MLKAIGAAVLSVIALTASPLPVAKPEEVGISSARLARVHALIEQYRERRQLAAGAVTVVARRGKLARFEAQGFSDLEAQKAARTDDIFRIASMTKPIATVGALMLLEEGKFLDDPVSKFIPESRPEGCGGAASRTRRVPDGAGRAGDHDSRSVHASIRIGGR